MLCRARALDNDVILLLIFVVVRLGWHQKSAWEQPARGGGRDARAEEARRVHLLYPVAVRRGLAAVYLG